MAVRGVQVTVWPMLLSRLLAVLEASAAVGLAIAAAAPSPNIVFLLVDGKLSRKNEKKKPARGHPRVLRRAYS